MKLESGELLILAGKQYFQRPIDVYGYRWKGRGFLMEETRLTGLDSVQKNDRISHPYMMVEPTVVALPMILKLFTLLKVIVVIIGLI